MRRDTANLCVMSGEHSTFAAFGLDARILRALAELEAEEPTAVQAQAIPAMLSGSDVLAKAKTGSGKTYAYVVPAVQSLLTNPTPGTRVLVLVPTRDLCTQVRQVFDAVLRFAPDIHTADMGGAVSDTVIRTQLAARPAIVVSPPLAALQAARSGQLQLGAVTHFILDEADLLVSRDYISTIRELSAIVPRSAAVMMLSATLPAGVAELGDLVLKPNHTKIDVTQDETDRDKTPVQYLIDVDPQDPEVGRYLLLFAFLKLRVLDGKTLVFTNNTFNAYKVRLFLERFGVRAATLTSELPAVSRAHIIDQFNRGVVRVLVTADESSEEDDVDTAPVIAQGAEEPIQGSDDDPFLGDEGAEETGLPESLRREERRSQTALEFGVARGIDFHNLPFVVNFDVSRSAAAYMHRIGRTARGVGAQGTAITLHVPGQGEQVLEAIRERQRNELGSVSLVPFAFRRDQIDQFQYRVKDVLHSLTKKAVFDCRVADLRTEIRASDALRTYVAENPADYDLVACHTQRLQEVSGTMRHLSQIPDYLRPGADGKELTVFRGRVKSHTKKHSKQNKKPAAQQGRPGGPRRGRGRNPLKFR